MALDSATPDSPRDAQTARPWLCPRCGRQPDPGAVHCPDDGHALVDDRSGSLLAGRFALRRLIGLGGSGATVWEGTQQPLGRRVAVKILPYGDDPALQRFDRGARLLGTLSHPHLVTVHDFGPLPDGAWFLAMERLRGAPLDRVLERGPLDVVRALKIARQVASALDHVHRHAIVHRDIKPANIFLAVGEEEEFTAKVLDFGLARRMDEVDGAVVHLDARITHESQICGTPEYMAPEQVLGHPVDARADVYALGAVLFRMLTGEIPFSGAGRRELYLAKTRQIAPRLDAIVPEAGFPEPVEALVARALARDPASRIPSARALRDEIRAVLGTLAAPRAAGAPASTPG